ncbi:MAG: glycosyl hydrolase 53 family protein [Bryobacteraceae bacterium]
MRISNHELLAAGVCVWIVSVAATPAVCQQPPEPTDVTPLDGEVYYMLNQFSGLQAAAAGRIVQQPRSFTDLGQRWAFANLGGGYWQISNIGNGLCIDAAGPAAIYRISDLVSADTRSGTCAPDLRRGPQGVRGGHGVVVCYVVQNPCTGAGTQQWVLTPVNGGYYTISNKVTGLAIDLPGNGKAAGTWIEQTPLSAAATQSQQWLLRPAFFRGIDNALLEKQEAARAAAGLAWWNDAGQPQDVLQIFKNHGVNLVRLRPSSAPPYANVSQAGCIGNACYGETEAQDLDLAKRAKNLGMSVELTLLFDGGSSASVPPAWSNDTQLAQLQSDLYAYVRAELLSYRQAGVMPDLVAIGNEVDTGFLGSIGSPTGAAFGGFAALQTAAVEAVQDAAADTSAGPAIPPPLTCIHITPAWDLTQFFTLANQFSVPYDAVCQSYYPIYHGPLTDAQAQASNPNGKPVEQDVLVSAANNLGKPIFIMETGEHFEDGFDANDPWYAPPSEALQRQFLLDLQAVLEGLPDNLAMGFEYWDPAGVNISNASGGLINGDNQPDAIYLWNGLTLFDDTNVSLLPGIDALGGKLDPALNYKFVNRANGQILSASSPVDTQPDSGDPAQTQQWRITSNDDGYFQIASPGNTAALLAGEWDIVSAGDGYFNFVNRASGLVLDISSGAAVQDTRNSTQLTQQWQIIPAH